MTKTPACPLVVYGETTGGPVCISSLEAANQWAGSDHEGSLYGAVIESIGTAAFFRFSQDYAFFNSETGNFALFKSDEALVLVEIVSLEEDAVLPWRGIEFNILPQTHAPVQLQGLTCFFDSSQSIQARILPQESIYAIGHSNVWNTVVLECDYQAVCEVVFESDTMHLAGICFLKKEA
ncbi:hypothetical protein GCM10011375_39010 [Hymenobacter qilianensis]|uniref:Uncharacterized protein n=2 Tax=Hymenobacter qilianensis TaxID=1385715 RepID=A0A7H0H193_9BACT|nr:hypothetical protein [Hymenobacter qilianensis]QNP54309.1 hypothetical protein H9L05_20985 [Hymenobacter qilianensis]GGF80131.1 hypothetical protein GCM10011375_39010 [Hymenobacter qilianensis]